VGTAAFLLNAVNQLIILSQEYSFVKWVIGLLVGSALIWVGATFETRREQIVSLMQNWIVKFQEWE
jgi:multisubunit Na+/H+ antiporter MnhE subunit